MFTACGIMHRRSCLPVTLSLAGNFFGALYHKLQTQSRVTEDGRNYRLKHVELIEITNKFLLSPSWLFMLLHQRCTVTQISNLSNQKLILVY